MPIATFRRLARRFVPLAASALLAAGAWADPGAFAPPEPRVVAYFPQWGIYGADFLVKNVETSGAAARLTHVAYAFIRVAPDTSQTGNPIVCQSADTWADYQKTWTADQSVDGTAVDSDQRLRGNFQQLRQLKALHPRLKVLASLGGWSNSESFSDAALTDASRRTLAKSCVNLLLRGDLPADTDSGGSGAAAGVFDGIDIDWEYPTKCGNTCGSDVARPEDAHNFTLLLAEFRRQMASLGKTTGRHYQLSIATSASASMAQTLEVNAWSSLVDFVDVMSYDYHGSWESVTNFNSPLYSSPADPTNGGSTADSVQAYLRAGLRPDLLVVGVPAYGRGWHGVGATANGLYQAGVGGDLDGNATLTYRESRPLLDAGYVRHEDRIVRNAWLYNPDQGMFWTYDDAPVMRQKAKFVACLRLGGVAMWDLSGDTADAELVTALQGALREPRRSCP